MFTKNIFQSSYYSICIDHYAQLTLTFNELTCRLLKVDRFSKFYLIINNCSDMYVQQVMQCFKAKLSHDEQVTEVLTHPPPA